MRPDLVKPGSPATWSPHGENTQPPSVEFVPDASRNAGPLRSLALVRRAEAKLNHRARSDRGSEFKNRRHHLGVFMLTVAKAEMEPPLEPVVVAERGKRRHSR